MPWHTEEFLYIWFGLLQIPDLHGAGPLGVGEQCARVDPCRSRKVNRRRRQKLKCGEILIPRAL